MNSINLSILWAILALLIITIPSNNKRKEYQPNQQNQNFSWLPDITDMKVWKDAYSNSDKQTEDSAYEWISEFRVTRRNPETDNLSWGKAAESIVRVCGKFFYRLPDTSIANSFLAELDKIPFDGNNHYQKLISNKTPIDYNESADYPPIIMQIWDANHCFLVDDQSPKYLIREKINENIFHEINAFKLSNNIKELVDVYDNITDTAFAKIVYSIEKVENIEERIFLYFDLATKLISIHAQYAYRKIVAEGIVKTCKFTEAITNSEKCKWLVGAAKSLLTNPIELGRNLAIEYLILARAYITPMPEEGKYFISIADRSVVDTTTFTLIKNIEASISIASGDRVPFLSYRRGIFDTNLLLSAQSQINDLMSNTTYIDSINPRMKLNITSYLYSLYQDSMMESSAYSKVGFLNLLADYYTYSFKYHRALSILNTVLNIQVNSPKHAVSKLIPQTMLRIAQVLKNKGEYNDAKKIQELYDTRSNSFEKQLYNIPHDSRNWTYIHCGILMDYTDRISRSPKNMPQIENNIIDTLEFNVGHTYNEILKLIELYFTRNKRWEQAYIYSKKVYGGNSDERTYYGNDPIWNFPKQQEKAFHAIRVETHLNNAITALIFAVIVAFYINKLRLQTKAAKTKAQKFGAKERISSYTIGQTGHLGPTCITKILGKVSLPEDYTNTLENLSEVLRSFYDYYNAGKITIEQEYYLILDYIDLAFSRDFLPKPSCALQCNMDIRTLTNLNAPMFVLFNAVKNAFEYGSVDENENAVKVNIHIRGDLVVVSILNKININNRAKQSGTGIDYMKTVLDYWNKGRITNKLTPVISDNYFQLTYKYKAEWNTR